MSGSPSFSCEIRVDLSELDGLLGRLVHRAEFWKSSGAIDAVEQIREGSWLADPALYTRPDRMRGGQGDEADSDGLVRDWGPGYLPYLRVELTSDGDLTLYSTRPFPPQLSEDGKTEIKRRLKNFLFYGSFE